MATPRTTTTAAQSVLAKRLADLREQAGRSRVEAARVVGVHPHSVRRWELGEAKPSLPTVEKLLSLYGATPPEIKAFLADTEQAKRRQWWTAYPVDVLPRVLHRFLSLESEASLIRAYEPHSVPTLLRTEEYARALVKAQFPLAGASLLERHVELVAERQKQCLGAEFGRRSGPDAEESGGPTLWVVLDETAVRRCVGGPEVMRRQVEYLISMTQRPRIKLQIVPHRHGVYPGMEGGQFHLFRFTAPELPDIVYRTSLDGGQYVEKGTGAYLEGFDTMCAGYAAPLRDTPAILRGIEQELWVSE